VRVSSPPIDHSCYFGIDTPDPEKLIAANHTVDEICQMIGADSLGYLSVQGLMQSIGFDAGAVCGACFTGDYPMELPEDISLDNGKACDNRGDYQD